MRGRNRRSLHVLAAAISILKEIQPCSVRALSYRLFIRRLIPNMGRAATQSVSRLIRIAREDGDVPWGWIVDESREAETVNTWRDPDQIIQAAVRGYRRDYWQDQPRRFEVWSEKGTVRGTLKPVLDEYGVTLRVMHGYASATVINEIARMSTESDKPLTALYVGDWDPSGKHMSEVDLPRRLEAYGGEVRLVRVALLRGDLTGLPSFDPTTKRGDPRYRWFRETVRTACYELDAMPPPQLRDRVKEQIRTGLNLPLWNHARRVERAEIDSMKVFQRSWQKSLKPSGRP